MKSQEEWPRVTFFPPLRFQFLICKMKAGRVNALRGVFQFQ